MNQTNDGSKNSQALSAVEDDLKTTATSAADDGSKKIKPRAQLTMIKNSQP
jgi:hypothetical protein